MCVGVFKTTSTHDLLENPDSMARKLYAYDDTEKDTENKISKNQQRKKAHNSLRKPRPSFQEFSHRMHLIPSTMSCNNTCQSCLPGKAHQRLNRRFIKGYKDYLARWHVLQKLEAQMAIKTVLSCTKQFRHSEPLYHRCRTWTAEAPDATHVLSSTVR